jgi:hypothetical protein
VNCTGRTTFVVDAHRGDGERFVVRADDKPTAFLELEKVTRAMQPFARFLLARARNRLQNAV